MLTTDPSRFPDAILRAVLAVDAGQADAVLLTCTYRGVVRLFQVWGEWDGDVFSWRIAPAERGSALQGMQIFAGVGDELDATVAAVRLVWMCAQMGVGEWSVA